MAETNRLVFGLDIGTRSIVGTVGYKKGKHFVVVAQCNKEHDTRSMVDGQIHDIGKVAETIRDVKSRLEETISSKLTRVCIAAAGRVLQTMQVHSSIAFDEEKVITAEDIYLLKSVAIEDAYKQFLEGSDSELKFYCVGSSAVRYYLGDFAMSNLENHKAKEIGVDLIATFLPDDVVNGLYKAVELAGLEVANLTLEPIAAIQLAIPERFRLLNIALVDVGAGTSDVSVTKDGTIIAFGMIPTAGDRLTERIANLCMVDFNTAESIKRRAVSEEIIDYEDIMGITMSITRKALLTELKDDVDEMATLAANKIMELNGGKSVGAVFVVGGGGIIPGYTDTLAEKLGLVNERVALRGKEVMNDIIFENTELNIDSLLVTPIGICLNFYEESNNFIFVTFNNYNVKLYNNNNLTVLDAALQTDFPNNGFFPKSGKELNYTVNGKSRICRGEMGEAAKITLNGSNANLNTPIKENDIITVKESTAGTEAHMTVGEIPEFKSILKVVVNETNVSLPKFVSVNGALQSEFYDIQDGDVIEILDYYTVDQIKEFMDISVEAGTIPMVNNKPATADTKVYENFSVNWEINDGSFFNYNEYLPDKDEETEVDKYIDDAAKAEEAAAEEARAARIAELVRANGSSADSVEAVQDSSESTGEDENAALDNTEPVSDNADSATDEEVVVDDKPESDVDKSEEVTESEGTVADEGVTASDSGMELKPRRREIADLDVIVNDKPITLKGKYEYVFVDIFDYIDFDLSKSRGTVVTTVNGVNAQYMQILNSGDIIEVYWKQ